MDEPWFRWSLLGIQPVHPKGWALLGAFLLIEAPLIFIGIGATVGNQIIQAGANVLFVLTAIGFFWVVFWKLADRRD